MTSRNTVECKADVCVADPAARNLHDNIVRARAECGEFAGPQRCLRGRQLESICSLHAHKSRPLPVNFHKPYKL